MHSRSTLLATVFALIALACAPRVMASDPPARIRTAGGFEYLVFETRGAAADATLPLIIGLHYSGGTPGGSIDYFNALAFPARIVLPRGPQPRRNGSSWVSARFGAPDLPTQSAELTAMADRLAALTAELQQAYPTRGKPLAVGVSYGGDLAFLLALRHPDMFAATFPVAARLLPEWMAGARSCGMRCPSIHALHGQDDVTVPMVATSRGIAGLATIGFDARLSAYPGIAHDFDALMQRDFARLAARHLAPD
ncbi:alpha/beta hydrolase [Thermomonas carbonis]|uniref:Dienelactone hydrolase family protein n=1 Tax=Thermomonas carbonis TaxID=1463158 RepID=A0A7G9ST66_9GAMM|nr:dienelactone hydrolase family protein [Thermomonas carbonis]QNN71041.1 dienelactone hydrolase family protein [Thermomonas carbonis]GHC04116.1 hypothetical protein GCM10010080_18090 [Thermomonas carbonis]